MRRGGNDRKISMIVKSNADTLVAVFGGSGFLGRHVVRALAKRQYRIRVAVRRPDLAGYLQPLGRVGQIHAVQANVRNRPSVAAAVRGSDVVINLVGILFESGRQRFDAVQSFGAEGVALAAAAHNARMIHVSAIGAAENSSAAWNWCWPQHPRPPFSGPRSCSGPTMIFSIGLPASPGCRRFCRWSAAGTRGLSRFLPAT